MTDRPEPGGREARTKLVNDARRRARRATLDIVRESGGRVVDRPVFRGGPDRDMTTTEAEPMAGLQAACHLEHAARSVARDCIRNAREDGRSWQEIGVALGLDTTEDRGISVAEAAYDYAASEPFSEYDPRSVPWTCKACLAVIADRGPGTGHPADAEPGHADGCSRLAATIAAWHASWDEEG